MARSAAKKVEPPSSIKDKVIFDGPHAVTDAVLEKAEEELLALSDEYLIHAADDIDTLRQSFAELSNTETDQALYLGEIFGVAHNIKGKGGTFGYDLATNIANQLCRFIEEIPEQPDDFALKIIELYIDTLARVNSDNLIGDGGPVGKDLLNGLYDIHVKWRSASKSH